MIAAGLLVAASLSGVAVVIDGDTFRLDGTHIRLFGIDAPERREQCVSLEAAVWDCGRESTGVLRRFLGTRPVTCAAEDTDKYGRTVATCTVGGEDIGRWMVRNGWARSYPFFSRRYVADEADARRHGKGIWR